MSNPLGLLHEAVPAVRVPTQRWLVGYRLATPDEAREMLGAIQGAPLLDGVRGQEGVDRAALAQGTAKAELARKAMGPVPEEIVTGERRPPFVPRKAPPPGPIPGNPGLHPVLDPSPESPASETEDADGDTT